MEEVKKQGMESLFCPYEQAIALKKLGFDEDCFGYYVDVEVANPFLVINRISDTQGGYFTLAPLYQQVFRWFREKYGIFAEPSRVTSVVDGPTTGFFYFISDDKKIDVETDTSETYEEAELECLKKLIELCKKKE